MPTIVSFGEVLLRLSCPNGLRLTQVESFDVGIAGAEANVAASCAVFGHRAVFVSVVPNNGMGEMVRRKLCTWDVEARIERVPEGRIGLYFIESGALQRPAEIIYDRGGSAFAAFPSRNYDWPRILAGADWFHTTGITPALSPEAYEATRAAMAAAHSAGIPVSFDPNYRARLWSLEKARETLEPLLEYVSLLISGTGQIHDIFGITSNRPDFEGAAEVAEQMCRRYGIAQVAIPRRKNGVGSRQLRSALFFDGEHHWETPWYEFDMVDPLGGGDAFAGALISANLEARPPEE